MKRALQILLAVLFGCFLAIAALAGVELGFRYFIPPGDGIVKWPSAPESTRQSAFEIPSSYDQLPDLKDGSYQDLPLESERFWPPNFWIYDSKTGLTTARPGAHACYAKRRGTGELIYQQTYHIDEDGFRVTPRSSEHPKRHAVFIGCSFTFGEGVADNETLPTDFERASNGEFRSYNRAMGGYGPNDLLARDLTRSNLKEGIEEDSGVIVYAFIDDHIRRAIGSSDYLSSWGANRPSVRRTARGWVIEGSYENAHPIKTALAKLAAKSAFLRYFHFDLPSDHWESSIETTASMIVQLRDLYRAQFPRSEFLVLLWPGSQIGYRLKPYFETAHIRFLDYASFDLAKRTHGAPIIAYDGHPSAETNRVVGEQLFNDLRDDELRRHASAK